MKAHKVRQSDWITKRDEEHIRNEEISQGSAGES